MGVDWVEREREMTAHEWADPHLAGVARGVTGPPDWGWWAGALVLSGPVTLLILVGWCLGWWLL